MPGKPVNKNLTRFSQISREFTDTLAVTMLTAESLDPHQIDGLRAHFRLINSQLSTALETLTAIKAKTEEDKTKQ